VITGSEPWATFVYPVYDPVHDVRGPRTEQHERINLAWTVRESERHGVRRTPHRDQGFPEQERPPGLDGIPNVDTLWATVRKECSHGVAFQVSYTGNKDLTDLIGCSATHNHVRDLS
jgi:hypothetical protein